MGSPGHGNDLVLWGVQCKHKTGEMWALSPIPVTVGLGLCYLSSVDNLAARACNITVCVKATVCSAALFRQLKVKH